jgi:hypothetical protein
LRIGDFAVLAKNLPGFRNRRLLAETGHAGSVAVFVLADAESQVLEWWILVGS